MEGKLGKQAYSWRASPPMALTDTGIRTTKPADKPQKLTDGGSLYLLLSPNDTRS